MSIRTFYKEAAKRDFARNFQFQLISFPGIPDPGSDNGSLVYVETASLPGRSITNVPVPYMGLSFNVPGVATYPGSASYAVTFRCDQNYNIRAALENSLFDTFDENDSRGDYNIPRSVSQITMNLLNKSLDVVRTYTLFGAYLVSLGDSAFDIKDTGSIQTIQATIAYQFWRTTNSGATVKDDTQITAAGSNSSLGRGGSSLIGPRQ